MARITGPATGNATLLGTEGDDSILAGGGGNTIDSHGGNDVISAGPGGYSTVLAGFEGDQAFGTTVTIRANGLDNTIIGGDADVLVTAWGGGTTLSLGNGDNTVLLGGAGNQVTVGLGHNDITAGGSHASVTVQGLDLFNGGGYVPTTTVHFSGTGNSFENHAIAGRYPLYAEIALEGGAGEGHFELGWGHGTVRTWGLHNDITLGMGSFEVAPGSGSDAVHLQGIYGVGPTARVQLAGTGNSVDGEAAEVHVTGGAGGARLEFQMAEGGGTLYDLRPEGLGNHIVAPGATAGSVIDAGRGQADVTLIFGGADITLRGSGNVLHLDAASATVHDLSSGLLIRTTEEVDATVIGFGADRGAVLEVAGPGSVAELLAGLSDDEAGNAVLALGGGAITFLGLHAAALHDSNFSIA